MRRTSIPRLALFLCCALAGSLRAQCDLIPNECCPETNVVVFVLSPSGAMWMHLAATMQVSVAATNDSAQGPAASSLLDAGAPGFATGSTCDIGPDRPVHDAGVGATVVSVHGAVRHHLPMPSVHTGLSGLAQLYPGLLVVDVSAGVYKSGAPALLTGYSPNDPTGRLPVPDLNPDFLVGGAGGL
ncbi:MAG: hypothetical protein INH34_07190 [Phycisphaerales bacterium]|nr:hypothetical protein [Phycisphaerales bacterium]